MPGKAVLLLLGLLTGALLALTGQVYQTGADTYELFGWWAVLILPWVLVGRFSPLWLVWLALLNLTVHFYFSIGWETRAPVLDPVRTEQPRACRLGSGASRRAGLASRQLAAAAGRDRQRLLRDGAWNLGDHRIERAARPFSTRCSISPGLAFLCLVPARPA